MSGATEIPHTLAEDIQALLVAPLLVGFAVLLFRQAGLLTGGTVGLAFLIHYAGGWPMGIVLFAINLPFYVFAVRAMGWE
ncbi:MAG: YitT family protein, partial [Rhodocyclales bacterium]|nr:YitT family protein [Rhodocyclales bacterium]